MHDLPPLDCNRRQPWRVAVLDPDAPSRGHLIAAAQAAGLTVSVAAMPRADVARLILQIGCDVVLLGMDVPAPEPLQLVAATQCPIVLCSGDISASMIDSAQQATSAGCSVRSTIAR